MKNMLGGIIYLESEWNHKEELENLLYRIRQEKPELEVFALSSEKAGQGFAFSEEQEKRLSQLIESCLFLGTSKESLTLAREYHLAVAGYEKMGKDTEEDFLPCEYLLSDLDQVNYELLERIYRRGHQIPWDILETPRCLVRELALSDLKELFELYEHPEITEFMEPLFDWDKELEYEKAYIKNMYGFFEYGMWLVFEKGTGKLIGRAGLENREYPWGMELELGYAIHPDYWGKGYATEVCTACLSYAAENLDYGYINCLIERENNASIALARKLGFQCQGEVTFTGKAMQHYRREL